MASALVFLAALVAAVSSQGPYFVAKAPLASLKTIAPAFPMAYDNFLLRANAAPAASPIYAVNPAFAAAAHDPAFSDPADIATAHFLENDDSSSSSSLYAAAAKLSKASAAPTWLADPSAAAKNLFDAPATFAPATAFYTVAPHLAAKRLNALKSSAFSPAPAVYAVNPQSSSVGLFDAPADVPLATAFAVPVQASNVHFIKAANAAYAPSPAVRGFYPLAEAASLARAYPSSAPLFSSAAFNPASDSAAASRAVFYDSPVFVNAAEPFVSAQNPAIYASEPTFHALYKNAVPESHKVKSSWPYVFDTASAIEASTPFINTNVAKPVFFDATPSFARVAPAKFITAPSTFAPAAAHLASYVPSLA